MKALHKAELRLAVYGTLAPGCPNHHQLADLTGAWAPGKVRGKLTAEGWGSAMGYPGLTLDSQGDEIEVQVFESSDLPSHWARLDAFEGDGYRRVITAVETDEGPLDACIYVLACPSAAAQEQRQQR